VRRILKWLLLVVLAVAAYLLLWPTPLDPYAWTPPPNPGTGPDSPFRPTQDIEVRAAFAGHLIGTFNDKAGRPVNFGPEDVAVSPRDGRIYTGLGDGRILRIDPRGGPVEVFANAFGCHVVPVIDDRVPRPDFVQELDAGVLRVRCPGRYYEPEELGVVLLRLTLANDVDENRDFRREKLENLRFAPPVRSRE
jgi:hypothetical protein